MIKFLSDKIPVRFLCRYFFVCPSQYYFWLKDSISTSSKKMLVVKEEIKKIFAASKESYGSPRIYRELLSQGYEISENTVAKYMQELKLDARLKKKFRIQTTDSNHKDPIAPRLVQTENAETLPTKAGEILVGDITYLKVGEKFIYLAVVLDLYNREVVGWSMGNSLETNLVIEALKMGIGNTGLGAKIIFHSDRGSQYASQAYRDFLKNKEITPSMSRKGNCYDNAYVESWFASLKKEWLYRGQYKTEAEVKAAVFEYIEVWYNKKRLHSSLGYVSPVNYKLGKAA